MSALLSVTKHETEKMALYVNDTRNMGVTVLQPDINSSAWDFTIEEQAGRPAIRFGLGAIKNVGQGSVELLVEARAKGGPFRDLNDLSARVDLRAVGKRALESLVKVGAMESFGSRAAMLEILDRIVAVSSSHFRAAEAGQLSLFGTATGVTENITLPLVPAADRRETLAWERELIGMYMGEHPLTPYLNDIRRLVTHFSSNLGEAEHEEKTRVAGMVSGIRPHTTKTGKMMAWVTLEDLTGIIELVLFPRTWEKFQFALEVGGVIVAEGKVDAQSNPAKVLVDNIRTEIKLTEPAQMALEPQPRALESKPGSSSATKTGAALGGSRRISETLTPFQDAAVEPEAMDWDSMPPLPEAPPEWEVFTPVKAIEAPDLMIDKPGPPEESRPVPSEAGEPPQPASTDLRSSIADLRPPIDKPPLPITLTHTSLKIPPTIRLPAANDNHIPQMLTVILRPTGNPERDIRRISRLHGTFISYPGKDRFAFQIFEDGHAHLIEFPNDSTHLCAELMAQIKDAVGEENLRVEPILYQ
jgi:DNA polymerase-3 subunit alpha